MSDNSVCGKAILLMNLRHGVEKEEFKSFFLSKACGSGKPVENYKVAKCVLMDSSEVSGLPHQILMADSEPPFDAAYQVRSPDNEDPIKLGRTLLPIITQLESWIDLSRSALMVGREVAITQGDGPIELIMPLRRRQEISHEDFLNEFFYRHTKIGEAVEGVRYRQNHPNFDVTNQVSLDAGLQLQEFDSVTESFFTTIDDIKTVLGAPQVETIAIEDEKRFINHHRSQFGFYRVFQDEAEC